MYGGAHQARPRDGAGRAGGGREVGAVGLRNPGRCSTRCGPLARTSVHRLPVRIRRRLPAPWRAAEAPAARGVESAVWMRRQGKLRAWLPAATARPARHFAYQTKANVKDNLPLQALAAGPPRLRAARGEVDASAWSAIHNAKHDISKTAFFRRMGVGALESPRQDACASNKRRP